MTGRVLRIGTRGSRLALRQTELVRQRLAAQHPGYQWEVITISTRGDERPTAPIASLGEGAFVKAIELALVEDRIDLAVHSLKDLPVLRTDGGDDAWVLAAFPEREDPRDVLIARDGLRLERLPAGARVATGSPRRAAQLLALRPDLQVGEIRGNVETRLRKLGHGEFDAIILAAAGLSRLGLLGHVTQFLEPDEVTPAVGQGALAVQCRAGDQATVALVTAIDDPRVRSEVTAERAVLATLGGGCRTPVGVLGRADGRRLTVAGVLCGESVLPARATVAGEVDKAEQLGQRLAATLQQQAALPPDGDEP